MTVKELLLFIIQYGFQTNADILGSDFIQEILNKEVMSKEAFLEHFTPIDEKAVELGIGIETAKKMYENFIITIDGVNYIPMI